MKQNNLYTVKDYAAKIKRSRQWVNNLILRGEIKTEVQEMANKKYRFVCMTDEQTRELLNQLESA